MRLDSNYDFSKEEISFISHTQKAISKNYLFYLFFWLFTWLMIFISFIWIIDPYGVSPIQVTITHFNQDKPKRLDIDRIIKPYEVWRYQPTTIFLGTSRIQQSMDPSLFDHTIYAPAYNAAVPANTLAENLAYIKLYLQLDPKIKHIFMELFLYNFTGQERLRSLIDWQQYLTNTLSLHISYDALFDSISTLHFNLTNKSAFSPAHIEKGGFRVPDGNFNPVDTFSAPLYIKTVNEWDRHKKLEFDEKAFETLDEIVLLAKKHNVQLHFFITPNYPWEDYRLLKLGYWPLLEKWLNRIATTYPNVISFAQRNTLTNEAPQYKSKMQWWNDPTHFSLNFGRMMLKTFLGNQETAAPHHFMENVNSNNIDMLVKQRRLAVVDWAKRHPDFVKNFDEIKNLIDEEVEGSLLDNKLMINGHYYPIHLGVGQICQTQKISDKLIVDGWAVDEINKKPVGRLVATIGNKVIARSTPTINRHDVEVILGKNTQRSGFSLNVPLSEKKNRRTNSRVFNYHKWLCNPINSTNQSY